MTAERAAGVLWMTTCMMRTRPAVPHIPHVRPTDWIRGRRGVHAAMRDVEIINTKKNPAAQGAAGS
ncbi:MULTISPECIES: hypothetical protein [Bradyrhizobium]|uniref:Uncharacterized protein n=1 Tax=Bradyrhizobium elkanii TaxID=29448 RepID=A0A4U6RTL1_BRAEL|nr:MULTISPECIES: hypothetical protein [Bradyrhizobium]MTV16422.1 hypothetical protein [Bradyrhizobium sp. BR2003]TKV77413.1 hypothetical protein FDV58_31930 [Bradyrhizobium elkanii]